MDDIPIPVTAGSGRLIDQLRIDLRARGYAYPTERTYLNWIRRFILQQGKRHPRDMGKVEIENFLNHLALSARVSPATQRTARNALMYLYTRFLNRGPESLTFDYAKPSRPLPTLLTHDEVKEILGHMTGTPRLMVELLYGSGLRLQECLNLRTIRHPPVAAGLRHPHYPEIIGPRRCCHHGNLYPRAGARGDGCRQPGGLVAVTWRREGNARGFL